MRGEYTKRIISMEEDKQALKEKVAEKYSKEISQLKKDLDERAQMIRKMNLLVEKQEEEIKNPRKGSK
jgi:hypothetical protein